MRAISRRAAYSSSQRVSYLVLLPQIQLHHDLQVAYCSSNICCQCGVLCLLVIHPYSTTPVNILPCNLHLAYTHTKPTLYSKS